MIALAYVKKQTQTDARYDRRQSDRRWSIAYNTDADGSTQTKNKPMNWGSANVMLHPNIKGILLFDSFS